MSATEAGTARAWVDAFKKLGGRFTTYSTGLYSEQRLLLACPLPPDPEISLLLQALNDDLNRAVTALAKQELGL